jgi:5-methylcytosine-specific restriction endonuclease McrA
MQRILVISSSGKPLMPCHPARARELLRKKKAQVVRRFPFTVKLKDRENGELQPLELKIDPGSRTTGIALSVAGKRGHRIVFAAELSHRGQAIRDGLLARRAIRRTRRNRKTRYRAPRFSNRRRPAGWLPPSLKSRVENVFAWVRKLRHLSPVKAIAIETVRFDMQKIVDPEISGIEYQQGALLGYELREYMLEKWQRRCAYCSKTDLPLEIEHIVSRAAGGSDRVSNLTLACRPCNQKKGSKPIEQFIKDKTKLAKILASAKAPLKDAAAVNATRIAIAERLRSLALPLSLWSGGRTKCNRVKQGYPKTHWIDAACVGQSGEKVFIHLQHKALAIQATGRGSRQKCLMDRYGFPRTSPKAQKRVFGFQTGDMVRATVQKGKKKGSYEGRVAVRATGNFNIKTSSETVQGISFKNCNIIQAFDGYMYA